MRENLDDSLRYPRPRTPSYQSLDARLHYSELRRYTGLGNPTQAVPGPYRAHGSSVEFSAAAVFDPHIGCVFFGRTDEKMPDVNTPSVVAFMQNMQSFGDRTLSVLP